MELETPLSVRLGNVLKFLIVETCLSILVSRAWCILQYRKAAYLSSKGYDLKFTATRLGRLTPVQFLSEPVQPKPKNCLDLCLGKDSSFQISLTKLKILLINLFLLASILMIEFGTGAGKKRKFVPLEITGKASTLFYTRKYNEGLLESIPRNLIALNRLELRQNGNNLTISETYKKVKGKGKGKFNESDIQKDKENAITLSNACGLLPFSSKLCTVELPVSNVFDIPLINITVRKRLPLSQREMTLFNFSPHDILLEVEPFEKGGLRICSAHNFTVEIGEEYQLLEIDNCIDSSARRVTLQYFGPLMDHELNGKRKLYEKPRRSDWDGYLLPGREIEKLRISAELSAHLPVRDAILRIRYVFTKLMAFQSKGIVEEQMAQSLGMVTLLIICGMIEGIGLEGRREIPFGNELTTINSFFIAGVSAVFVFVAVVLLIAYSYDVDTQERHPVNIYEALQVIRAKGKDDLESLGYLAESKWPILGNPRSNYPVRMDSRRSFSSSQIQTTNNQ